MYPKLLNLQNKKALVTGAASGLGKQIALTLARMGADVAVADVNSRGAVEISRNIKKMHRRSIAVPLDVANYESVRNAIENIVSSWNRLDIAVNAAGVAEGHKEDQTAEAVWKTIIDINLSGLYYCCIEEGKVMMKQKYGKIINIASMSAIIVNRFPSGTVDESRLFGLPPYCASKAGVKQLTKVLAGYWAKYNIRVNCISPGYMDTPLTSNIFKISEVVSAIKRDTPVGRVGVPKDLGGIILYLASDISEFMTGSEIVIDGGYSIW